MPKVPSPKEYAHTEYTRGENDEILNQLSFRSLAAQEAYGTAYLIERWKMAQGKFD